MSIFGDGDQSRAFSYVADIVPPIVESAGRPDVFGEVFNIGADRAYSVRQLADEVAAALGVESRVVNLPARNEVMHAYADHAKLRRFFGEQPATSLAEGLARMSEWVRRVGVRPPVSFEAIEVDRNLPPSWRRADGR
jgi:UDP-glucose 4-epimerase